MSRPSPRRSRPKPMPRPRPRPSPSHPPLAKPNPKPQPQAQPPSLPPPHALAVKKSAKAAPPRAQLEELPGLAASFLGLARSSEGGKGQGGDQGRPMGDIASGAAPNWG